MTARLLLAAPLLFATCALAQQPSSTPDGPPQPQGQWQPHHFDNAGPGFGGGMDHDRLRDGNMEGRMHGEGFDGMHGGMRHGMDFGLPPGEWWHNPMLATRIGLSADQIKHLDELSTQGKLDIIHLHAALEEDEVLLKPMLEGATLDEHKAEAQIDKIADARAAIEKAMAHNRLSERAVLTADQVTKLHDHSRPGMDRGMHRWGNGDNAPAPASGQ